ncbi:MAG TPA: hypothetical protein VEY06_07900 [Flavisolibacter sp.]|jgi:hypothetical protein|nr:hypothetical protein [Flavisolibacter sp.]
MLAKLFAQQNRKKVAIFYFLTLPVVNLLFREHLPWVWIYLGIMLTFFFGFTVYGIVESKGVLTAKDKFGILLFVIAAVCAIWRFSV